MKQQKQLTLNYCEFDLSKVSDTKAGYFEVLQKPTQVTSTRLEGECRECKNNMINQSFIRFYSIQVCDDCIQRIPEKYSLLTKTECRSDYLLTEGELKDSNILPHWIKPNPRKQSFASMLLYCRCQVEDYAFKKWGGEEGLDLEISKRQEEASKRKRVKFMKKTKELRQKTMTAGRVVIDSEHEHVFGEARELKNGMMSHQCKVCQLSVEFEEF